MSPNYNLGYGSKRISSTPRKGCSKFLVFFILLILIAGGVSYILFFRRQTVKVQESTSMGNTKNTPKISSEEKVKHTPEKKNLKTFPQAMVLYAQAEKLFKDKQPVTARDAAVKALAMIDDKKSSYWKKVAALLSKINIELITSDCPLEGKKERYIVKSGDSLGRLARKFNTTISAIQRGNGIDPGNKNIMIGQTLYIYKGNWNIKVSKSDFMLYLLDGNEIFKIYNVGIGRQNRTPTGNFRIASRTRDPAWYSSKGEKIPFGDKRNVLGTRWMNLKSTDKSNGNLRGYGIHGTWDRESIGKSRSNGCIRMLNEDVEELFSLIPLNTKVVIEN